MDDSIIKQLEEEIKILQQVVVILSNDYNFLEGERVRIRRHILQYGESKIMKSEKEENIIKREKSMEELKDKGIQLKSLQKILKNLKKEDHDKDSFFDAFFK
jgi:hypothetical protein